MQNDAMERATGHDKGPLPNFQNLASSFSMRFIDKVVDAFSHFGGAHSKSNNLPVGWGSYPARFTAPLCPDVPKCAQMCPGSKFYCLAALPLRCPAAFVAK